MKSYLALRKTYRVIEPIANIHKESVSFLQFKY